MARDDRDVLEVLKAELDFIEKGGYGRSVRTPWKPTSVFVDSPSCLNLDDPDRSRPCNECLLMEFVPPERRAESVPCHRIPLNKRDATVDSLAAGDDQGKLEETVKNWLRGMIRSIEDTRIPTHPLEEAFSPAPASSARKRVLVIDDDEQVLTALDALLEDAGCDATTAWSGREALRMLRTGTFDLVVLDDYLADVTSEEILRHLQKMPVSTPVLLMQTGVVTQEEAARYARLGARPFVNKGQPMRIAAVVRDHLSAAAPLPRGA